MVYVVLYAGMALLLAGLLAAVCAVLVPERRVLLAWWAAGGISGAVVLWVAATLAR